jgi:putative peptidoglycan lipid II flippase
VERSAEAQIARGAGIVMAGFALSSLIGLLNRMLYSGVFGTGVSLDAFLSANKVPDILFNLMAGGALASAFIPMFATFLTQNDRVGAWRLASSIGNLLILGLSLAATLVWIAAPWIVPNLLVPGYDDPAQIELVVDLLRIQLIALVLFGISGLVMSILNAHQRFALPALAPSFNWLGWIIGIFLLVPRLGIYGLAWGVVLGALFHLLIQLPGLRGLQAQYSPTLGTRDPAVRQIGGLMVPRVFGVAVVQLNFLVNIILASTMVEGSLTGISLGFAIMLMPQIVIAQAIAIAALPTFSTQVASGQISEMRESLATTLRGVVFLSLPASLGLLLLRRPIVSMLFERGEFDSRSTDLVAWALLWYAAGLVGHALVEIISRAFYALKDTTQRDLEPLIGIWLRTDWLGASGWTGTGQHDRHSAGGSGAPMADARQIRWPCFPTRPSGSDCYRSRFCSVGHIPGPMGRWNEWELGVAYRSGGSCLWYGNLLVSGVVVQGSGGSRSAGNHSSLSYSDSSSWPASS